MSGGLRAISGPELIKLLKKIGWQEEGRATHGLALSKKTPEGRTMVTVVPTKSRSLPKGTLSAILKQTGITRDELQELLKTKNKSASESQNDQRRGKI
jgi:predicted RNA binding protein YcfA (HicA-like mRNA interferase family)